MLALKLILLGLVLLLAIFQPWPGRRIYMNRERTKLLRAWWLTGRWWHVWRHDVPIDEEDLEGPTTPEVKEIQFVRTDWFRISPGWESKAEKSEA